MAEYEGLAKGNTADGQGLVDNIRRKGTPSRVFHMELFHDGEILEAITEKFDLMKDVDRDDEHYHQKRYIAVQRFCGMDYVRVPLIGMSIGAHKVNTEDTSELARENGRTFQDEHTGPIMSWEEFEKFEWPDPNAAGATAELEWYTENLPEEMIMVSSGGFGHFCEWLSMLMGYEKLCFALFEDRDLVKAIADKTLEINLKAVKRYMEFDRIEMYWGSDDMGFKTGLLISPNDMREFVLGGHKAVAAETHKADKPYLLHSCGDLSDIMDDLIHDVKIDAKHSFEDTIEDVKDVKKTYGQDMALIGGIDVDFLCRSDEESIRKRVRETLDVCMDGGGYILGTGNSVANYIPVENYLAMVDEGLLYGM